MIEVMIQYFYVFLFLTSNSSFTEPEFLNLFRSRGIDSQPGDIDSWASETFTNTGSELTLLAAA